MWQVGILDNWAYPYTGYENGYTVPQIFRFDSTGNLESKKCWNTQYTNTASTSWYTQNSGGSGHITVTLNSTTAVSVTFTFPTLTTGQSSQTWDMQVGGSTSIIQLEFDFPASIYSAGSGESWHFTN